MKNKHLIFIISGLIACALLFIIYQLYRDQQELRYLLSEKKEVVTETPQPTIIEKIVKAQPWSTLQSQVKNTVVQIFAQVAAVDLLQPYKTPSQYQGTGSGFFINGDGEIITNAHVVDQAKAVWIQIPALGKRQVDVDVIGVSPDRDLALLKIRAEGLQLIREELGQVPFLPLGDSDLVHRADEIMTLGYPLGQQGLKSTTGVVSGREQHLIQIDAPINPGNSGGPSLNMQGEVIGINTLYAPDAQNVGYIIPINELKIIIDDLHIIKLLRKPFLGILFNNASEALTKFLSNPLPGGLYVVEVYKDSPLHKAGVQKRDMIYEINGIKIDNYGELQWNDEKISIVDYVAQLTLGQPIKLVVYRQGKKIDIDFIFNQAELLPIRKIYPGYEKIDYEIVAGMVIQPLTINHIPLLVNVAPGLTKFAEMKYQMEPVIMVTHIFPDSLAQRSRSLVPGAILAEVNGVKVKTLDDVRSALFKGIDTDTLTMETADAVFVVMPMRKMLEEERRLSKDYFYQLSPVVQSLLSKVEPKESLSIVNNTVNTALPEKS